jgi:hypothetical protein
VAFDLNAYSMAGFGRSILIFETVRLVDLVEYLAQHDLEFVAFRWPVLEWPELGDPVLETRKLEAAGDRDREGGDNEQE